METENHLASGCQIPDASRLHSESAQLGNVIRFLCPAFLSGDVSFLFPPHRRTRRRAKMSEFASLIGQASGIKGRQGGFTAGWYQPVDQGFVLAQFVA